MSKTRKPLTVLLFALLATMAPLAGAQIIVNDQFDSGDLQTNPTGVGTGYQTRFDAGGTAAETGGVFRMPAVAPIPDNAG